MKKPSPFKVKDLISFGLPSILLIAASIAFMFLLVPFQEFHVMMWVISALVIGAYSIVVAKRAAKLSKFKFVKVKNFALMIEKSEYSDDKPIKSSVLDTVQGWSEYFGDQEVNKSLSNQIIYIYFKKAPLYSPNNQVNSVAGYNPYYTNDIYVSYKDLNHELKKTAFEHELGHVIQGLVTGVWDQSAHHKLSAELGLP